MQNSNLVEEVKQTWEDIESWYKQNSPNRYNDLLPGASDSLINQFESRTAVTLPEDYKASLKTHNGDVYIHSYNYLSLEGVLNNWQNMLQLLEEGAFDNNNVLRTDDKVQNSWWNRNWIPFAEDSGGNMICLDMAPADQGTVGQVLYMEIQEGPIVSKYSSFLEWLQDYKRSLYDNVYEVDEEGYLTERL